MAETKELTKESNKGELFEQLASDETLEIIVKRDSDEVILRNPKDNRIVKLKASFEDAIKERLEEEDDDEPLTPEQFEDGLRRIDALGLTFTVDLYPSLVAKNESSSDLIDVDELEEIRKKYPTLPREVGFVAHSTLTGREDALELFGGSESFERKSQIIKEVVLTQEYKSDFFFKHALKVPFFEGIDWEVNFKTHEKGVKGIVYVPYALLMLTFHNPNPRIGHFDAHQNVTVAVNKDLLDTMLATLNDVRTALNESHGIAGLLNNTKSITE